MECKKEGNFQAKITAAKLINHRFKHDAALEIKFEFATAEGETGAVYLDMSQDYIQAGAKKNMRQCDASIETLKGHGIDIMTQGKAAIQRMVGAEVGIYGKNNKDNYLNFYLSQFSETEADNADAKLAALFGSFNQANNASPAPATGGQAPNPFFKK